MRVVNRRRRLVGLIQ